MNDNGTSSQQRRTSRLVLIGALLFVVGCGPLLITILLASLGLTRDPNPNPVGFGILALFTFWPSVIVEVIGIIRTVSMRKRNREFNAS